RGRRAGLRRRRVRRDDRLWAVALRPSDAQVRSVRVGRGHRLLRHAGVPGLATVHAAAFREYGGPEVLRWEELADPVPAADEVIVEVRACRLDHHALDSRAADSRSPFP